MWRLLLVVAFLAPSILGTPYEFHTCNEVEFCKELRDKQLTDDDKYSADIDRFEISTENVATIPLINKKQQKLNLVIYILGGRMARVIVEEDKSTRFSLENLIIEKQPQTLEINGTLDAANTTLMLTPKDSKHLQYYVEVVKAAPFKVNFYNTRELQMTLNADQLLMNNKKNEKNEWYTFKVDFIGAKKLFGLSYHPDDLTLRQTIRDTDPYRLKNNDAWNHTAYTTKSLYGSIPVIYGHSTQKTVGIFLHNAAEQWVDIDYKKNHATAYFMVERAAFDLYILLGPLPPQVFRQLTILTGQAHMPQIWTLGYHQCRFSYHSQEEVIDVVTKMDENDIPFDAIWLDGDHANYSKWFQFNETTFPEPAIMQKLIADTGRVCVSISDPHIKVEDGYPVYDGAKGKYFIRNPDGTDFQGDCWPGTSSWIDFLNPEARDYYASWYSFEKFNGSTPVLAGIWNDMNEPAVFNETLEKTAPVESVFHGGVAHGNIHNIYGFLQTMATYKGLMERDHGRKRPFILTRSHFAGSQRYAAMWTGDNFASWEHLRMTFPQCMTSNLGGMVVCGADIGGFIGDPDEELLQRWYQTAAWTPFFRGHSSRESERREPYLNDKIKDNLRSAIRLRYKHIPTWYTAFYEYTTKKDPIIRPLFYNYPTTVEGSHDRQLLVGSDIMAVSVTYPGMTEIEVFFPGPNDVWYRIDDDSWKPYKPGNSKVNLTIKSSPVFYRGGSIIVRQDAAVKHTGDMKNVPFNVHINLDSHNEASGTFYMDDYVSFNYRDKKSYFYVELTYTNGQFTISTIDSDADMSGFSPMIHDIIVHGPPALQNDLRASNNIYTTTRDGRIIKDIDISAELKKSSNKSFVIPL